MSTARPRSPFPKRQDAALRQQVASECLPGFDMRDRRAYHLWLLSHGVPEFRRGGREARHRRDTVQRLTVGQGQRLNAIRVALASPSVERLRETLLTLARLLHAGAESFDTTE
jgi:hypothetical protein